MITQASNAANAASSFEQRSTLLHAVVALISALVFQSPAHAGDFVSLPAALFCKVTYEGKPAYKIVPNFFRSPQETGAKNLIDRQGQKVRDEFVQPAMDEACAKKQNSGAAIADGAKSACQSGCAALSGQWGSMVDQAEQKTLRAQCDTGCDVGFASMYAWAYGVGAGLEYKK